MVKQFALVCKWNWQFARGNLDCSQPPIFLYFYSIIGRADRIVRELDASARGRLDWGGGGGCGDRKPHLRSQTPPPTPMR